MDFFDLLRLFQAWLPIIRILVACQVALACIIFTLMSSYNSKHKNRMEAARAVVGKTTPSLFELPAFRTRRVKNGDVDNPFLNNTWSLTVYEQLRVSIMAVTLFPFRIVGFISSFLGTFCLVWLLQKIGLNRLARTVVSLGGRIILFCFGYYWISIKGKQAPGIGVLVSNHCSFIDGLVWVVFANARPVAEEANFANPIMNAFAKALECVLFSRTSAAGRQAAQKAITDGAVEAHEGTKGPPLVFPTGTTTTMNSVITFKVGAFAPALPVQPGVLHYRILHCDPAWVAAGPGSLMLLFRMMCQLYNRLDIEFLDVHKPTDEEKKDPHVFARAVQLKVAKAMEATVTAHAVEDVHLQNQCVKLNLPPSVGVVGFSALREVFSVNVDSVKKQLEVFAAMDKSNRGVIDLEEFKDGFAKAFHDTSENQGRLIEEFFFQLTGGHEHLDFRKFLIGLALVNEDQKAIQEAGSASSTSFDNEKLSIYAKMAFAAFAKEKDDVISRNEFIELWTWLHPQSISDELAKQLGIPGPVERCESRRSWFRRLGSKSSKSVDSASSGSLSSDSGQEDPNFAAGRLFDLLSEGRKEEQVTWSQFEAYSKQNPIFIKDLRHAFFDRLAQAASNKS